MIEDRRQKLLELYGIGVIRQTWSYAGDEKTKWFGVFYLNGDWETDNCKTRREAEDQAIADYESISETGEK